MTKTIKLAVSAAILLSASSAFATNGDNMIGQGAKSRAMGGVGIAKGFGANSGLANPAMINSVANMEVEVAATVFMPSVTFKSNAAANANPTALQQTKGAAVPVASKDSDANMNYIPELAFAQRINENFVYGFAVTGVAGMGTDYDATAFSQPADNGSFRMKTALSIAKVSIPLAYETHGLTVGVSPILQYGSLEMSHMRNTDENNASAFGLLQSPSSSDTGFGFEAGFAYDLKDAGVEGLTVGAVYKSAIAMEYKDTISKSMAAFGVQSVKSGDKLEQPAEMGVGLAYEVAGNTIAFDYRNVAWGDAEGYKDFGWENQNVFAVGYEYAAKSWALRAGYNYAKNPIKEQDASAQPLTATMPTNFDGAAVNFFNMSGFPGVVEKHVTFGGSYAITEALGLDASIVYAPKVTFSYDTSAMTQGFAAQGAAIAKATEIGNAAAGADIASGGTQATAQAAAGAAVQADMANPATSQISGAAATAASNVPASTADVTHSQMGVTVALTYKF